MYDAEQLYELLPAIYRIRDAAAGEPLRALIEVLAEQSLALEENLAQGFDDQFIETAAAWAIPYIGDLIGVRGIYAVDASTANGRAEVANTIAYRRRKGTAAVLEQLARDVTGWNARVVEFFQLLATTQYMNHIRPGNLATPDLRQWRPLAELDTPFTTTARTADVRRIASAHSASRGQYNIPNVGIFLWRIGAYSLTDSPAAAVDDRRFTFDPLGRSLPIFNDPVSEEEITHLAEPINVPQPLHRRVLAADLDDYYSEDKNRSLCVVAGGLPVPSGDIVVCDLSDRPDGSWAHTPPAATLAIDPELGRLAFHDAQAAPPLVTFHYGFSADMGGGEYARQASFDPDLDVVRPVVPPATIQAEVAALAGDGVVELQASERYTETPAISVAASQRVEVRARDATRPLLQMAGDFTIDGDTGGEVILNGLLIAGGALRIGGAISRVTLRHCTLLPGAAPSLLIDADSVTVTLEACISGALRAVAGAEVVLRNSIVDALDDGQVAFAALDGTTPGGTLTLENSTIIGRIYARELPLVSNAILLARAQAGDTLAAVHAERTQAGCVRFSYLPHAARTPRRFRCQPEQAADELRMRPQFTSLRYGDPGYGQLSRRTAAAIRTGADDEAEMGAFHDLLQPQRETNLRLRLEEYLRFGLEAGIFYGS